MIIFRDWFTFRGVTKFVSFEWLYIMPIYYGVKVEQKRLSSSVEADVRFMALPGLCPLNDHLLCPHYNDVIMGPMASQITSLTIVYSTVYSGVDHRKHQSSAPLAFVRGIHGWPVNSPYKWPATRKMFPFNDVIMIYRGIHVGQNRVYFAQNSLVPLAFIWNM